VSILVCKRRWFGFSGWGAARCDERGKEYMYKPSEGSAVINGLLAPPLILLVILLTNNHKVMGKRVNSPLLRYLGWATFGVMTAAAVGMVLTS